MKPSLEYELERRRLELETQRQQDLMLKTLGPVSEVVRRREERILVLRKLDQKLNEVNSAIANHLEVTLVDDLCNAGIQATDWLIDKDVWQSSSSLDLHMAVEKHGHSVNNNN